MPHASWLRAESRKNTESACGGPYQTSAHRADLLTSTTESDYAAAHNHLSDADRCGTPACVVDACTAECPCPLPVCCPAA